MLRLFGEVRCTDDFPNFSSAGWEDLKNIFKEVKEQKSWHKCGGYVDILLCTLRRPGRNLALLCASEDL